MPPFAERGTFGALAEPGTFAERGTLAESGTLRETRAPGAGLGSDLLELALDGLLAFGRRGLAGAVRGRAVRAGAVR